jgi:hypothetical protein
VGVDEFLQIVNAKPMTDEELLARLRQGLRFSIIAPGDWEFVVSPSNTFVLRRTR